MNEKKSTQQGESLGLKPNYDLRLMIKDLVKLSPDPVIRKQSYGWWPRLIAAAFRVYIAHLLEQKAQS